MGHANMPEIANAHLSSNVFCFIACRPVTRNLTRHREHHIHAVFACAAQQRWLTLRLKNYYIIILTNNVNVHYFSFLKISITKSQLFSRVKL